MDTNTNQKPKPTRTQAEYAILHEIQILADRARDQGSTELGDELARVILRTMRGWYA